MGFFEKLNFAEVYPCQDLIAEFCGLSEQNHTSYRTPVKGFFPARDDLKKKGKGVYVSS